MSQSVLRVSQFAVLVTRLLAKGPHLRLKYCLFVRVPRERLVHFLLPDVTVQPTLAVAVELRAVGALAPDEHVALRKLLLSSRCQQLLAELSVFHARSFEFRDFVRQFHLQLAQLLGESLNFVRVRPLQHGALVVVLLFAEVDFLILLLFHEQQLVFQGLDLREQL